MEYKRWLLSVWRDDRGRHVPILWSDSPNDRWEAGRRSEDSRDITVQTDNGLTVIIGPVWARRIRENGVKKFHLSATYADGDIRIDYVNTD
jgi:hypothetical protein